MSIPAAEVYSQQANPAFEAELACRTASRDAAFLLPRRGGGDTRLAWRARHDDVQHDLDGLAAGARGQAACARGDLVETLLGGPGVADHCRVRLFRLRIYDMVRITRTGKDPSDDRPRASSRNRQGARARRRARKIRWCFYGSHRQLAR